MSGWETIIATWWTWIWAGFWQFALLAALVATIDLCFRNRLWPQLRAALWMLVLLRLLLPPTLHAPWSLSAGAFTTESVPFLTQALAQTADDAIGSAGLFENALNNASAAAYSAYDQYTPSIAAWTMLLFAIWATGVVTLTTAYAWRLRCLSRAFRNARETTRPPAWLQADLADVCQQAELQHIPRVVITDRVSGPAVFGLRRPCILVPGQTINALSRSDLRNILLHEIAHIRRRDLWFQAAIVAIQILFWFNPFVYLIRRRLYELRELCCDATVSTVLRDQTPQYRDTLLEALRQRLGAQKPALAFEPIGLLERTANVVTRLRALENPNYKHSTPRRLATCAVALAVIVTIMPMGQAEIVNQCRHDGKPSATDNTSTTANADNTQPGQTTWTNNEYIDKTKPGA